MRFPQKTQKQQLLTLARERHFNFKVVGEGPLPAIPFYVGSWVVSPISHDNSLIPEEGMKRVRAIYEAGIEPKGWVLAHELTTALPPYKEAEPVKKPFNWKPWAWISGGIATAIAAVLLVQMVIALVAAVIASIGTIVLEAGPETGYCDWADRGEVLAIG